MLKNFLSIAGRYGLALGAFALVLLTTITISRLFSFSLDLTSLIILGMPNEDGYSLIRKIRALKPEEGGVPATALTAYVREEDRLRALDTGFQTHIPKPVDPDKLAAEVASLAEHCVNKPTEDGELFWTTPGVQRF
ncbi:MAG TPA: response regulator [Pyrinomonadaceae bacterium]|jgi:CheY-like chemotaxis protein